MTNNKLVEEFERIKELADEQKEKRSKISGQIEYLTNNLKELGLTHKEAEQQLAKLKKQLLSKQSKLNTAFSQFKEKYHDKLQ